MSTPDHALPTNLDDACALIAELRSREAAQRQRADYAENNLRCFRELAEHIPEVFWMTNAEGDELVYVSPAYEHIWGQSCDSLHDDPGKRLAWIHDDDRERVLIAFKRDARNGDFDQTYRIIRPDGHSRWIRDRAFPIRDSDGAIHRLAGFAIDITDHVDYYDRMTHLRSTLTTQDRISILAILGTGLAHELGQPLTAARTFITQACRSADGPAHALQRADQEIERASAILSHLRNFARHGKPTLEMQPLGPILRDLRRLLDPALRAGNIHYTGPAPETLASLTLPVDAILVQQILKNLISNAIEAFDDSSPEIRRITVRVHPAADHVDIEVGDNGTGITEDASLFTPFATTKHNGLGLGLVVSRSLARSHGGELYLVRDDGAEEDTESTRFVLRLPRAEAGAMDSAASA